MKKKYGARRYLAETVYLPRRILDLEAAVMENRQLNRRLAELTDILAELLVPATQRDEEKLAELLARFRSESLTKSAAASHRLDESAGLSVRRSRVIALARAKVRTATASAISSGSRKRPSGFDDAVAFAISSAGVPVAADAWAATPLGPSQNGVATAAGETVTTRTPASAYSLATALPTESSAALDVL